MPVLQAWRYHDQTLQCSPKYSNITNKKKEYEFSSVYLFAIIKFNSNYNNNNTFGRQSRKQFAYLKDCFKEWSRKLECKLSLAEQKYWDRN